MKFLKIKSLVSDDGESLSLGRIAFWVILAKCLTIWEVVIDIKEKVGDVHNEVLVTDIPIHLFYTLSALLLYCMYSKVTSPRFIKLIKAWKGTDGD